jgi:hypothetical protein
MAVSNSLFLTVRPAAPAEQVGWTVRVLDYRDFATPVAQIAEFVELQVGPELGKPGNGSLTLDLDAALWTATLPGGAPMTDLLEYEYLLECYEDGALRFQFLAMSVEETIVDADGTRQVTIAGPGIAHVLSWACVLPRDFPPAKERPYPTDPQAAADTSYFWQWPPTTAAMPIWLKLLQAAQARGTISFVTPLFTAAHDSAGKPWQVVKSNTSTAKIVPEPGSNLLELLDIHTGQDLDKQFAERVEWMMWPGFRLDVRATIGVCREKQVVFFEAQLPSMQRTRSRDEIANLICTLDAYGDTTLSASAPSKGRWLQREQLQNRNLNVTDPARRRAIGEVFLAQRSDEKSQWTIQVPYDEEGRRPFVDYDVGDWVGVVRARPSGASVADAYRVMAIVVKVDSDGPTVELTLQSLLEQQERALQKRLTMLLNTAGLSKPAPKGSGTAPPGSTVGATGPDGSLYDMPLDGLGGGGNRVFIQPTDPALVASNNVQAGDFWLQTTS